MPILGPVNESSNSRPHVPANRGGGAVDPRDVVPTPVRIAGWIATLQGLAGVLAAVVLTVRAATGHHEETVAISGYGTAGWFLVVGGAVLAAGVGLLRGRRWGGGLVVMSEILLVLVAWYVGVDSSRPVAGLALAAMAVVGLVMLFRREALAWYTA